MSNWISNAFSAVGAGLVGAAGGFLVGGPIGAMAGFGIGMFGAAAGMSGNPQAGAMGGAMMGGMVGMAMGGPIGMMAGGLLGGMLGNSVGNHFSHCPCRPDYSPYMGGQFGGCYGMPQYGCPPFGGQMGYPGGCGFPQGGFGMQMPCQGMGFMMFGGCFGPPQMGQPCFPPQYGPPQQGGGQVSGGNGQPVSYTTQGGYHVTSEGGKVTITTPDGKHTIEHSGDPHEYLDGQRVKDWEGKDRTILLPDGTRITMNATGPTGTIQNTTIYDGGQEVAINNNNNTFTAQFNPYRTQWDRSHQAMGETAVFGQNWNGGAVYRDIFTQQYPGMGVTPHFRDLRAA